MLVERSHKTFAHLVMAVMTAAMVFYSEQALATDQRNAGCEIQQGSFALHG